MLIHSSQQENYDTESIKRLIFWFFYHTRLSILHFHEQINENIRMVESSSRLEWLQSHVNLEGLGEVSAHVMFDPSF